MLCVGVLITLSGSIEQDSLYKRRTYLVWRKCFVFNTSAVTFSKSHFRVFPSLLIQRYSTKCPFCAHTSTGVGGGCSHYVFDTHACSLSIFAPSNEYSSTADSCCHTPTDLPQFSANFTSCKITRLPRSPPLLFRDSVLPAVILITHVHQICL